jgi:hypothetical protein
MALPMLEATAGEAATKPPMRLVAGGVFFGFVPGFFHPEAVGADYRAPRLLEPLERHRQDFTVFSGLDHNISGGHEATKYFLSGIPMEQAKAYADANVSVDQKAAMHVGTATRFPSLSLGCEAGPSNYISWSRHGSQVRPVSDLEALYELLFREPGSRGKKGQEATMAERESVLDLVREQAKRFETGLGPADRDKLDQYFTSLREMERKVEQSRLWLYREKPKTGYELPRGSRELTLREKVPLFYDLMVLALQTDSTRVMTLAFQKLGKDSGGLAGVTRDYHALSHHGKEKDAIKELTIIESFYMGEFARFLDKLQAVKESNGTTLLDNTMVLFGSGMSNANSHSNRDLPVILAGGGFQHGQHRHYARDGRHSVPLCNLYLTMLQRFGLALDSFNTSSGTLTGLA